MTLPLEIPDRTYSDALISADGVYRYSLTRIWEPGVPLLAWCGLNPSTADWKINDPTIRREMDFSKRWGYGGLVKVNMFGLRATKPAALVGHPDPIGPDNDETIWRVTEGLTVVAAWGASYPDYWRHRIRAIGDRLRSERTTLALGFTKAGAPRHPLYIAAATEPVRWAA